MMKSKIGITIFIFCFGVICPMSIWGKGANMESYQELIRNNFTLRKDLKTIENKYADLENERKVLILHVRELQTVKGSRSKVIQNLKNMIASLRIEMLKDPKLTKTIDSLNQRVKEAESQKDLLEEKVRQLESEKKEFNQNIEKMEALVNRQKERDGKGDAELAKVKKEISSSQRRIKQLETEKKELGQKIDHMEAVASKEKKQDEAGSEELVRIKKERSLLQKTITRLKADKKQADQEVSRMEALMNRQKEQDGKGGAELAKVKKKISSSQRRIKQLEAEKKELEQTLDQMNMMKARLSKDRAALEEAKKERENFYKKNSKLEKDLKMAQVALEAAEGALRDELAKVQDLEKSFKDKMSGLKKELAMARRLLDQTEQVIRDMKEKEKGEGGQLTREMKRLDREKSQLGKQLRRLEANLRRASGKNRKLDEKIARLMEQVRQGDVINRQLMRDLKEEQQGLKYVNKSLRKEKMKSAFERQHFEEQLKFARVDQAMFEVKIQDLQQRTLIAETRRGKIGDELAREVNKALLKESEVVALREEKSKLEKKLLKYIEKAMDLQDEVRAESTRRGAAKGKGLNLRTKKQIAQQKLKMHYNMAIAYNQLMMYDEEEKEYRKCLKINSNDANVHYNLAILYDDRLNENSKAIRHYKRYLQLHSSGEGVVRVKEWLLHAEQEDRLGLRSR